MKKLLVLVLVLGIGSLASAGLSFNVGGLPVPDGGVIEVTVSDVFAVQIVNDLEVVGPIDIGWYAFEEANAEIAGPAVAYNENMPGEWSIGEYGPDAGMFWYTIENEVAGVGDTLVGPLFEIVLHCTAEGPVLIEVWNYDFDTVIASMTIIQTPEPASMALLGLGGLFLRRRR